MSMDAKQVSGKSGQKSSESTTSSETAKDVKSVRSVADAQRIPVWATVLGDGLPPGLVLQTKLMVSQSGDPYEQEAERVAEQVMRTADLQTSIADDQGQAKHSLLRKQSREPGANSATQSPDVPPIVHDVLNSGGGQSLDTTTRAFMETRFGHDFSKVRVHTDERAAESAQAVGALAYTVGQNVVFGTGQYTPEAGAGQRLLAHELTHVIQQMKPSQMESATALPVALGSAPPNMIQAKEDAKSINPIEDILPPGVGVVESIDRYLLLIDLFGEDALDKAVKEIHGNEAAKKLVQKEGVVAILALIDTRGPRGLDPAKAETKLATHKELYRRSLLTKRPEQDKEKSFLFQGKPPAREDKPPAKEEEPSIGSAVSESQEPFVEPTSFKVGEVAVRIAHLRGEWRGDKPTAQMKRARDLVIEAVRQVLKDLNELPPAPNLPVRREDERARARLKEAFRAFGVSRPLYIFIASELTTGEMLGKQALALKTDQVYVNPEDIGDPTKLQAAIRVPLINLLGGTVALSKEVKALTPDELKEGVLHEAVHALLITRGMAANQIWESIKSKLVEGPPTVKQRCEEVVHRYLLAQEESFVYGNVGKIYPMFIQNKDVYDAYRQVAEAFFVSKSAQFGVFKKTLDVKERVAKQKVDWSISFKYPKALTVGANDITLLNELAMGFPG